MSCWVVVSNIFYFHPYLGKMNPIWRAYFSNGLKPPTRLENVREFTKDSDLWIDLIAPVSDGVFRGKQKQVGCFMRANVEDQCACSILYQHPRIHKFTNNTLIHQSVYTCSITLSHHPPWPLTVFRGCQRWPLSLQAADLCALVWFCILTGVQYKSPWSRGPCLECSMWWPLKVQG